MLFAFPTIALLAKALAEKAGATFSIFLIRLCASNRKQRWPKRASTKEEGTN